MIFMTKIIFVMIIFLLFIWRIQRGFYNGIMRETVTLLSGAAALVSAALVFFAVSSYREKALSMFVLCVIGLSVLGIVFKICSLIFEPILALSNLSIIGGLDKILGGIMGAAEAVGLSCLIYFVLNRVGVYVL